MSKEFDEFMNGIQKEDEMNKDLNTQPEQKQINSCKNSYYNED